MIMYSYELDANNGHVSPLTFFHLSLARWISEQKNSTYLLAKNGDKNALEVSIRQLLSINRTASDKDLT